MANCYVFFFQHETGLCKNLLQEYAQKMNYAIPLYQCQKDEAPGRTTLFSCSIEIGGIRYIGAAARTKKEAEIKAARTALLAIQSSASESNKQIENPQLTVLPCKKRAAESNANVEETPNVPKPKKARFKKKTFKKKFPGNRACQPQVDSAGKCDLNTNHKSEQSERESNALVVGSEQLGTETMVNPQDGMQQMNQTETEQAAGQGSLATNVVVNLENGQSTVSDSNRSINGTLPPMSSIDTAPFFMAGNEITGARDLDFQTLSNSTTMAEPEICGAMANVNQSE